MDEHNPIKAIEQEIDDAFAASPLLNIGYAQAAWTLLSMNEDAYLRYLHELPRETMHIFVDTRVNALTYPLRLVFTRCKVLDEQLRHELI